MNDAIFHNTELTQLNTSALQKLNYTPAFLVDGITRVSHPLFNKQFNIMNPFSDTSKVKSKQVNSNDTMMHHVKGETSSFTYHSKIYGLQFNQSMFNSNFDMAPTVLASVIKQMNIEIDKALLFGDGDNVGIKDNAGTVSSNITPADLEALYNSIINDVKQNIYAQNETAGNGITLFVSVDIEVAFSNYYGGYQTYWEMLMNVLKNSNVTDVRVVQRFVSSETFYCVMLNDLIEYHLGYLPQVYQSGENQEGNYRWYQLIRQSIGIRTTQKPIIYRTVTAIPATRSKNEPTPQVPAVA